MDIFTLEMRGEVGYTYFLLCPHRAGNLIFDNGGRKMQPTTGPKRIG